MASAFLKSDNIGKSLVRHDIGIACHKTSFMVFYLCNHRSLIFYALRTVYEGDPTLLCKRHSHAVIAYSLHDGAHQRDVCDQPCLFSSAVSYQSST
jgi:hypothetical protein